MIEEAEKPATVDKPQELAQESGDKSLANVDRLALYNEFNKLPSAQDQTSATTGGEQSSAKELSFDNIYESVKSGSGKGDGASNSNEALKPGLSDHSGSESSTAPREANNPDNFREQSESKVSDTTGSTAEREVSATAPIGKGEGPYQAFRKLGQSPEEAARSGRTVNKETGLNEYKQGDRFQINIDGSVTHTENSRVEKGRYSETVSQGGKVLSRRNGDAQGNYVEHSFDRDGKVVDERSRAINGDGGYTETAKNSAGNSIRKFDAQGNETSADRENADGSKSGWKKEADGSISNYSSPDKDHATETVTKDGKIISETQKNNTLEGPVQLSKRFDGNGGSFETGTGPSPEQNFTKSDDGKGNVLYHRADGKGFSRTQEPDNSFVETHYGPTKLDNYSVKGDGKGNNVETRLGENGTRSEKHSFTDNSMNYTAEIKTDANGSFTEKRSHADSSKDFTMSRKLNDKGGYVDSFSYSDGKQNYTREVDPWACPKAS